MKKVIEVVSTVLLWVWFGGIMMKGSLDILKPIFQIELVSLIMIPLVVIYLWIAALVSVKIIEYIKSDNHAGTQSKKQIKEGYFKSR